MEKKNKKKSNIKILNNQRLKPQTTKASAGTAKNMTIMFPSPTSPTKQINLNLAKNKMNSSKQKKMDHYVLHIQNIKGEADEGLDEQETIDFILTNDGDIESAGTEQPPDESPEEINIESDEDDEKNDEADKSNSRDSTEHVCGKCYKTFRRFNGLKKHLDFCRFYSGYHLRKQHMIQNLDKIERDARIMERKDICFCCGESYDTFHLGHINCPDCPKSFKTQASYERHIFITHSENNDCPCTICNAKLRSETLLELHIEQHKNRGKPFACKICGREFTRSYHLKRHQKYSSCSANESDAVSCKVCDKVFYRVDNLRAHLKYHLGTQVTKKPEYMCPICKNCFYSLSTLNIHTRTHTGERPFDCDLCEKKFSSLVALKKHRRYHTGEKPYTCSVCNQCFAVKEVLNRHMKRHTNDRPHVCEECGKSFIQATQLRTHSKTHIRPFACSSCDEKFKTEKSLMRHVKTHKSSSRKRRKRKERTDCVICEKNFETAKLLHFHILKVHEADPEHVMNLQHKSTSKKIKAATATEMEMEMETETETENATPTATAKAQTQAQTQTTTLLNKSPVNNKANDNLNNTVYRSSRRVLSKIYKFETDGTNSSVVPIAISKAKKDDEQALFTKTTTTAAAAASAAVVAKDNNSVADEQYLVNDLSSNKITTFTIIPLDTQEGEVIETVTTQSLPEGVTAANDVDAEADGGAGGVGGGVGGGGGGGLATGTRIDVEIPRRTNSKKSLAASLAAAIADDDYGDGDEESSSESEEVVMTAEDLKLKDNVGKLLDMLVDSATLKKFGWPESTEELVLCKVIENCGHDLSEDAENYKDCEYATRMREYVKLLFTVVIHNDSIKELLNNYSIDEVIEYVLGADEDEDEDENDQTNAATCENVDENHDKNNDTVEIEEMENGTGAKTSDADAESLNKPNDAKGLLENNLSKSNGIDISESKAAKRVKIEKD